MAFRKKAHLILAYKPDILVVQECEHPDKLKFNAGTLQPKQMIWLGTNQNKGLGIFSYGAFTCKLQAAYNPAYKMIVPVTVKGLHYNLNLYGIWANNPEDPDGQYVEQVWKAIHYYNKQLKRKNSILAGDFNSNTIWDRKSRAGNHSAVVKRLEEKGIHSAYHRHHKQAQGKETHPTFYLYRHVNKPYHLDYCFVSENLANNIQSVEIGDHAFWSKYSDHVPVMVTFRDDV